MERRLAKPMANYLPKQGNAILESPRQRENRRARTLREWIGFGLKAGGLLATIMLLSGLTYLLHDWLLHTPRFAVTVREIQGLRYLSEAQVLQSLKEFEDTNQNLYALNLDRVRKSLELLPWVKQAQVRRVFPSRLIITIRERVPIAYVRMENRILLIDEDGILLENRPETLSHFDFPIISGLEPGFEDEVLARNKKRLRLYQLLIEGLDGNGAALSRDLSEVHLQDTENVSVILNDDTVLVHLGDSNFQWKFRYYLANSRELKQKFPAMDSVDLRYSNQVVVNAADQRFVGEARN
ncbi:MAG: FtsQ-type POTRA domain-containing protein [Acidobacteriota bacterium]